MSYLSVVFEKLAKILYGLLFWRTRYICLHSVNSSTVHCWNAVYRWSRCWCNCGRM